MMDLRKSILVVDDSSIMRRLVREIVESDPDFHVIDTAENGKVALQKVRLHKPDCILLDIEMPELSGLDTMRRLGLRSPSKIVILSSLGYEGSKERAEALRLGAADVIDKPSGSVSMDIKAARGSLINQTLRRVLGLSSPVAAGDASAAPTDETVGGTGVSAMSGLPAEALDVVGQAVLAFDISGRLFYANVAASRMLGETVVRPGTGGLDDVFGGLNEVIAEEVREVLASGEAKSGLAIDFAADAGHWLPCVFDLRPTPDPGGRGNGVLVVIEDKSVEQSLRKVLNQTMSASVTEAIVDGQALGLEGKETDATILFSDIRAFTSLCESLSASALVTLLNEYFTFMADVIRGNRGIIDKYIGDAIMALFGVPNPDRRTADNAVQAAIGMIQALDLFNEDRRRAGDAVFQIGIGIANGPVIAGTLGSPERMNYTVIGDAVNLASRIEGLTKAYGAEILICGSTSDAMAGPTLRRRVDVVRVKGQETATPLVQVLNRAEPGAALNRSLAAYAEALEAYEAGRFAEAEKGFANVVRLDAVDATAAMMRERCRLLHLHPPADWVGVWKLDSK